MRMPRNRTHGFTLMELLVAAGLLAMMGLILGTSISAVMGAIRDNREMQDRYHSARVALGRMQREVAMAYLSKHQGEDRTTKTVFLGKSDQLTFIYMGHRRIQHNAEESDQGVVEYYLERQAGGLPALIRREKVIIDDVPEKEGRRQVLAEDVRKLRFEYWDMDKESWESDWKVEIDNALEEQKKKAAAAALTTAITGSASAGALAAEKTKRKKTHGPDDQFLPGRVRITIVLATDDDELDLEFETQSRIRMMQPLDFQRAMTSDLASDPLNALGTGAGQLTGANLKGVTPLLQAAAGQGLFGGGGQGGDR